MKVKHIQPKMNILARNTKETKKSLQFESDQFLLLLFQFYLKTELFT